MYFEKFPLVEYKNFEDLSVSSVLATNILKRVAFRDTMKDAAAFFVEYTIKDGETPESIAYDFYGDTELYWTVLLFNDIINPYHDWPMSQNTLDALVLKKYPGKTFFVSSYDDAVQPIFEPFIRSQTIFKTVDPAIGITAQDLAGNYYHYSGTRGSIESWEPHYQRLVVTDDNGTGDFAENDILGVINGAGNIVRTRLERLVHVSGEALHHFEYDTIRPSQATGAEFEWVGNTGDYITLDPLATPHNLADPNSDAPLGRTGGPSEEHVVEFYETNLGRYMGMTGTPLGSIENQYENVISNRLYEERLNDKKRQIRLLRPEHIADIVDEFNELLSEDTPQTLG